MTSLLQLWRWHTMSRFGIKPVMHLLIRDTCTELMSFHPMLRRLESYAEVLANFAGWCVKAGGCSIGTISEDL